METEEQTEQIEEIKESKTKCTLCGLCKTACPCYKIFLDESVSPRGKATMIKRDFPSNHLYLCTLCKACENACILKDIDIVEKIRNYRQELVGLGMVTEATRRMIANIRRTGNAIGEAIPGKKIELFCC